MIVRSKRSDKYLQLDNTVARDMNLSLDTRGFHHHILSYSKEFETTVESLMSHFKIGREKLLRMTNELKKFGYLEIKGVKDKKGVFVGKEWVFYDVPQESKIRVSQDTAKPNVGLNRTSDNPHDNNRKDESVLKNEFNSVLKKEEDSVKITSLQAETALESAKPQKIENPVERRIWTDGVELMKLGGVKESNARSLLGKLAKEYGNDMLAESIAVTQSRNAVNPHEFLIKVLKEKSNGRQQQYKPNDAGTRNAERINNTNSVIEQLHRLADEQESALLGDGNGDCQTDGIVIESTAVVGNGLGGAGDGLDGGVRGCNTA